MVPTVKKERRPNRAITPSRIGARTSLNGALKFDKEFLICGEFHGTISGRALLVIDNGARVDAEIDVDTLIVRGNVQGRIVARVSVVLEAESIVAADIQTKDIRIAENAQYEGECVMSLERGQT